MEKLLPIAFYLLIFILVDAHERKELEKEVQKKRDKVFTFTEYDYETSLN